MTFAIAGGVLCAALTLFVFVKTRENGERNEELVAALEAEQASEEERVGLLSEEANIGGRGRESSYGGA